MSHAIEPYRAHPAEGGGQPTAEQLVFRWLTTKRTPNTRFAYGRDIGVRIQRPGAQGIGEPGPSKAPDWLTYCASRRTGGCRVSPHLSGPAVVTMRAGMTPGVRAATGKRRPRSGTAAGSYGGMYGSVRREARLLVRPVSGIFTFAAHLGARGAGPRVST